MVVTDDDGLADRLRMLRNHGTRRTDWRATFVEPGFNYRMSDINAALGLVQVPHHAGTVKRRSELAARLDHALADVPGVRPQVAPTAGCTPIRPTSSCSRTPRTTAPGSSPTCARPASSRRSGRTPCTPSRRSWSAAARARATCRPASCWPSARSRCRCTSACATRTCRRSLARWLRRSLQVPADRAADAVRQRHPRRVAEQRLRLAHVGEVAADVAGSRLGVHDGMVRHAQRVEDQRHLLVDRAPRARRRG